MKKNAMDGSEVAVGGGNFWTQGYLGSSFLIFLENV